ncbi:GTP cyclohydrolase I [Rhizobium sp. BK176]|nr:GTP cyclohydrolase I [Rhizobium sp. BK181]MBB3542914.1 GTP cyclohydrolase I [Rhizobium sp. BK399]MCS3743015.1 GTP cyclohydrolase I [Rhizobium sp. BK661]MCS4095013.1 GTP cyclohydrolase I [Rhizobium sp. BK176]
MGSLAPKGAAVLVEAEHLCMAMRGIQKQSALAITNAFEGDFKLDAGKHAQFMMVVRA